MYTISFDQAQKRERTQLVLKRVTSLSPVPKILSEVLELLKDLNTSPHTLARAISKDQSIVVKILTIANSPFYGLAKRVSSIEYAIMILGFNEIRNIVTALSLMESMKNKSDEYMDQKSFWLHSYITATTAKKIADDMGIRESNDVFIGGLLHDLGISVIHRYMHSDFVSIMENAKKGTKYLEAENSQLGMDHQSVGYTLLKNWNIPESICEIVKYHHTPNLSYNTKILTSIVHLADYMTQKLKLATFSWDDDLEFSKEAAEILQFKEVEEIEKFISMYHEPILLQIDSLRYLI
ncbi:MAG: HDOD domain-containing protein [Melioribacter sp.]|uniref:HDOD domain-containing protein n=1 Tax=Rosettibacter primus TaxID=3111523 RepID=UPI00247BA829|nr:HDOD domain-containing protein [Melioribacter sp.]